jgi:light-regulated signal transduction histidine kinase (bacteriophytochrome)
MRIEKFVDNNQQDIKSIIDKADRMQEELQQLAYVLSHDLVKPIRLINFELDRFLNRCVELETNIDDLVVPVKRSIEELSKTISLLYNYISLDSNQPRQELICCNELLAQGKKSLENKYEKFDLLYYGMPQITAVKWHIEYIFHELIENSIKFYSGDKLPKIRVEYKQVGDSHQFEFIDNNDVIEEEYREIIFTLFQRLHSEEEVIGRGLGLAMVKKMIHLYEGNVWVEPYIADFISGNKFIVTLKAK